MADLGEGPGPSLEESHGMEVLAKPWALVALLENPGWPSGSSPRLLWLQEVTAAPSDPTDALQGCFLIISCGIIH